MTLYEVLAVLATILAGSIRTSVGVGAGIGLAASLSLLFDPHTTLAILAFLQIGLGGSAISHYWRRWDAKIALQLIIWMLLGIIAGTWLINAVPIVWARRVLGTGLVSVAVLELIRRRGATDIASRSKPLPMVPGFLSGVAGSTANAAGAVVATYLKRYRLSHESFLSTLAVVVMSHDLLRLVVFWRFGMLSAAALKIALLLIPFAFLGGWLGKKVAAFVNEKLLSTIVLLLVALAGALLLR